MRSFFLLARFALVLSLAAGVSAVSAKTPVYLLGTLYQRHADSAAYGLVALKRAIGAIDPDVLVLDVSPDELEQRKVFPGKIEYTQVVFPLLEKKPALVTYAAEPGEPMYGEIVQSTIRAFDAFKAARPALSDALKRYTDSMYALLDASWRSPADAQSTTTGTALLARSQLVDALVGDVEADGRRRWNAHIAAVVVRAAREHPGRRVLVLTGIENRPHVEALLKAQDSVDLVDMAAWLRARSASAPAS